MKRTPAKPVKLTDEQIRGLEATVFALVEQALAKQPDARFYLLAVDFEKEAGYWYLRIYVDGRDFAISLSDCEQISRALDPLIDAFAPLQDLSYSMEVSSPGLFRPLKTQREFDFYRGRPVRIEAKPAPKTAKSGPKAAPLSKSKKSAISNPEGILQAFDEQTRTLTVLPTNAAEPLHIALGTEWIVCLNPEVHFPDEDAPLESADV